MRAPPHRGLADKTLSAMFWVFSGHGLQAALQLLVLVVLARLLDPEDFGLVGAALVVSGFALIFSQLGVGPALVQRPTIEPRHVAAGFAISLVFGGAIAATLLLAAPLVALAFRMPGLTPILRGVSVVFVFQAAAVVAESLLQRALNFRALAAVNAVSFVVGYAGVAVVMAWAGFGAWALVGGVVAQAIVRAFAAILAQPHPVALRLDAAAFRELMTYGAGFTLGRMGNYAATNGDNAVVASTLGAAALGFYGRAFQLMAAPTMLLADVLDKALFPAMARVQDDPERLRLAFRRGVALAALVSLPASLVLILLAPDVVRVVLGPGWSSVVLPLQLLAAAMLVRTSYRVADSLARATGIVYARAWRQWLYAALVVAGAWAGSRWGIAGVAAGVAAASLLNFLSMAQLGLRAARLPVRQFVAAHVAALPLALLALACARMGSWLARAAGFGPLPALAAAGGAVGLLALLALRLRPAWLLGEDGRWMANLLVARLRRARAPPVRVPARPRAAEAMDPAEGAK